MKTIFLKLIKEIDFESSPYSDLVEFIEGIGFSIRREYPKNILNKIGVIEGEKYIAFIQFRVQNKSDNDKYPIDVRCKFLHYNKEEKELDFDFSKTKRNFFIPSEVFSPNEFYLDIKEKRFLIKNRKGFFPIEGKAILDLIFERHLKTLYLPKLIVSYVRKDFYKTLGDFCSSLKKIIEFILKILFGVIYKYDYFLNKFFPQDKYDNSNGEKDIKDEEQIATFWGFKVAKHKLFVFSLFHLIFFFLLRKNHYIKYVIKCSSSSVIIFFYVIVAWIFFSDIIPYLLKKSVNILSFLEFKLKLKS